MREITNIFRNIKLLSLVGSVLVFAVIFSYGTNSVAAETSGNINLKPWKLTLPVNSGGGLGGKAAEIIGRDLTTYTNSPWYVPVKTNGQLTSVKFYAVARGATTSNSGNPRSELREMKASNPSQENNWSPYSGTHRMLIKQKVTILQGRRHVVIGQIHDKDSKTIDDYAVFRLQGTQLWAYVDGSTSSGKSKLLDGNVGLNQVITVGFAVQNGTVRMYYDSKGGSNPPEVHAVKYPSGSKGGAYFKAGNYCQCGSGKGYSGTSGVEIVGLDVTHDGSLPDVGPIGPPADTDISGPDCQARGRTWITGTGCERDCKDGAGNLLFPTTTRSICKNAGIAYGILGMTKTQCQDLDRRELAVPNTKYCAKRWDQKTVANAPQCEDPKAGYARFTYIHDASGDYCGYW